MGRYRVLDFLAFVAVLTFFGGGAVLFKFFRETVDSSSLGRGAVNVMLGDLIPCTAGMIWILFRAIGKRQWCPPRFQPYIKFGGVLLNVINFAVSPTKEDFLVNMFAAIALLFSALYAVTLFRKVERRSCEEG